VEQAPFGWFFVRICQLIFFRVKRIVFVHHVTRLCGRYQPHAKVLPIKTVKIFPGHGRRIALQLMQIHHTVHRLERVCFHFDQK
jgi:hypothetical protein